MDHVQNLVKETYFAATNVKKSAMKEEYVNLVKQSVQFLVLTLHVNWSVLNLVLLVLNHVIGVVPMEDVFYLVVCIYYHHLLNYILNLNIYCCRCSMFKITM